MSKQENMIEGVLENKEEHVHRNLRLIWSVVQRFNNRGYDPNDLFQLAAMGYMKAFDRFDDSYGVKWSTYAVPMMIGEIQRFIRDDGTIKTPRRLKELHSKFRYNECDGMSREEIAEKLELDLSEVDELLYFMKVRTPSSIEQTVYENDGDPLTISDMIGEHDDYSHTFVNEFLETLDERAAIVVKLVMDNRTQSEIGKALGISQVQVSRIIKNQVKPLLEKYLKGQGQFDNVVKERAPQVRKSKPKKIKQESVVVMFNAKKPLNGLTVEIYHKMRNEGNSNGKIQRHFKLNNAVYYGWKKENGLTDAAMAAKISNGAKGVKKQGDKKKMMATAIKPATSASQVSKMDKVITDLEQTVESYKQQVSSRDQEIKRLQKQADQKHISYEEAVATLNETWENKVFEKESVINQLETAIKHKDSNVKYVQEQLEAVRIERDKLAQNLTDSKRVNADVSAACRDLSEENVRLKEEVVCLHRKNDSLEADYQQRNESYERVLKEKHQLSERYDHLEEEGQRAYNEAVEYKRLYEEELKRANELEVAVLSYKKELEEAYECNDNKQKTLDAFEEANDILARKHKEMNKNFDDFLDKVSANDRVHQEEVKMLHDKIEKLQGTLKLYL
ncbi:RNA polymerase sigma factor [Bacillus phage Stills]|uniref:RNA polymerase sigma factor n=1 Tax=Bacillus phage Stills TaxID=1610833 RepID=A0A0E3T5M9_9CAUD|nr:RNA polymerase sigma factor [Bacillus phage Stills]AKC02726.1 RNA polymerase sigma factor [Bacillus phage Stills]